MVDEFSRIGYAKGEAVKGKFTEVLDSADDLGLYAFAHDDWSWHFPNKTALILYMQKTPVKEKSQQWNGSFRKWVIERSKLLEQGNIWKRTGP